MSCFILGLVAIVAYKAMSIDGGEVTFPYFTMFSAHSWMGVVTLALWTFQLFFSIWLFAVAKWPTGTEETKQWLVSVHHFVGQSSFVMGLATCATGLQDMQSSDLASTVPLVVSVASDAGSSDMMTMMTMPMTMSNATMMGMGMNTTIMVPPYDAMSTYAQMSSACSVLLLALGVSTFAALKFLPRVTVVQQKLLEGKSIVLEIPSVGNRLNEEA